MVTMPKRALRRVDDDAVQPVGAGEGERRGQLVVDAAALPGRAAGRASGCSARPAAARNPSGRTISTRPGSTDDRGRAVHRLGDGLEARPSSRSSATSPSRSRPRSRILLHAGRVQHRDQRVDEGVFGLVRQGRGLAGVVVAGQRQHAAMRRGAGRVAVLEHVAAAVDARPLAVPHARTRRRTWRRGTARPAGCPRPRSRPGPR